jgi:hypothetical protein
MPTLNPTDPISAVAAARVERATRLAYAQIEAAKSLLDDHTGGPDPDFSVVLAAAQLIATNYTAEMVSDSVGS